MADLRQCPFCGEKERLHHVENITGLHYIECGKCGAAPSRLGAFDYETAIRYWNGELMPNTNGNRIRRMTDEEIAVDDLINRKKLLDDINNLTFYVTLPYPLKTSKTIIQTFFDSIIEIIKKSPSESGWIPCSERLPENFVWCLVCMSDGCIRLGKWNSEYDEQGVWWVSHPNSGGKLYRIKNVPFWMPLPELPEQEVSEDD